MEKNETRERAVMNALNARGKLNTEEVMEILKVSDSTARRIFIRLENKGEIIRIIGGIQLAQENPMAYSFERINSQNLEQKVQIGLLAASMIEQGDVVYLDSGTTTVQICNALTRRITEELLRDVSIFTNSLANLNILSSVCTVHLIGGEYRMERRDFCGFMAEEAVKLVSFNKCFVGADGFVFPSGFTTSDFATASLNQIVLLRSRKKIVVADSSKFHQGSFVTHAKTEDVTCVITDHFIADDTKAALLSLGVNLLLG